MIYVKGKTGSFEAKFGFLDKVHYLLKWNEGNQIFLWTPESVI